MTSYPVTFPLTRPNTFALSNAVLGGAGNTPSWAPPGSYSAIDFTVPQYFRTPAVAGLRVDSGVGSPSEEANNNQIRNNTMQGLVAGTIGSGGSYPTNWQTTNSVVSGSVDVSSVTLSDGTPAIDVRFYGTPSASGSVLLQFELTTQIVCTVGDTWTSIFDAAIVAGSTTNVSSIRVGYVERTSGGTFSNTKVKAIRTFMSSYMTTFFNTATVTAGARLCPHLEIVVSNGSAIDITIRLARMRVSKTSKVLSNIATTNAAVSRSADTYSTPVTSGCQTFQIAGYAGSYDGTLLNLVDASSNGFRLYRSSRSLFGVVATAGVEGSATNLGYWPDGMLGVAEVTATPSGNADFRFNGKPVASIAGAVAYSTIYLGCKADGTGQWDADLYSLGQWQGAKVVTPQTFGLFDDFQRANGSIGTAWSGQSWVQIAPTTTVVTATISSNALVAPDSGQSQTAAYQGIDFGAGKTFVEPRALIQFSNATTGGNVTLISNPNGLSTVANITNKSVHVSFTDTTAIVSVFLNGVQSVITNLTYVTACSRDGSTIYEIGWKLDTSASALTIYMPDGNTASVVDARFAAYAGQYGTWEQFWTTGQTQTKIFAAYGRAA